MGPYQFDAAELALLERTCVPVAVYQLIDRRVVTIALSAGFCELFGYERDEAYRLMDDDMYRDTHPDDVSRIADAALRFATEEADYDVVYRTKSPDGYLIVHAHGQHVRATDGTRLAVVWYTDEGPYPPDAGSGGRLNHTLGAALHEETLYQRNYYDYLTGLPNMTYFLELATEGRNRMLADGERPALLFFDLNGMKFFNRTYGFAEGDRLIRAVGRVLARHFSAQACSRFGQDHFAVFTQADGVEERLYAIFDECLGLNEGKTLPLRVGIYCHAMDNLDVATACDRAKFACGFNRQSPVSTFRYFDETQLAKVENEQYIVRNLDKALKNGWIQVYYQPIIRTANGLVCDEEALSRWIDPHKGFLSPAEFIPALEDAKTIYKLDLYVLEQVLQKIRQQQDAGLYVVPQSLNLSRADFDNRDIVEEIRRRVDAAGVDRSLITIEVTESMVGSDVEFMKRQIRRFQDLGFQVWMDDFGSGYSSLDLLQSIRFDLIKLDMSFMRRFDQGDKSKIILTELVKMAISLGVDTVSEGVETKEQADFLRDIGCSKIQGYYYCKPIPFSQIVERNRLGIQIGFENPDESDYFAAVGRINLYDLAVITHDGRDSLQRYFNTIPMAIYEVKGDEVRIARCNGSYRDFLRRVFGIRHITDAFDMPQEEGVSSAAFLDALRESAQRATTTVLDEELLDGEVTHLVVKHIATNQVTGTVALVLGVLAVVSKESRTPRITFAQVAQALSSDYRFLFYVDLDTEEFAEYSFGGANGNLAIERHGEDFFRTSRENAPHLLHEDDQGRFIRTFTKQTVVGAIDARDVFTITYRQFMDGEPRYMSMKGVRMAGDDSHIILGVSDIHEHMVREQKHRQEALERVAYTRIMALSDEYLGLYVVDPESEHFMEYDASDDYAKLGLTREGTDFFAQIQERASKVVHPDDVATVTARLSRDELLGTVQDGGSFLLHYRLLIGGQTVPVRLKATLVEEREGPRLIIGVTRA